MKNIYQILIIMLLTLFACSNDEKSEVKLSVQHDTDIAQNKPFVPFRKDYIPVTWDTSIKQLKFDDEQLEELIRITKSAPAKAIRNAFNDFLNNINPSDFFEPSAVGDSITIGEGNGMLAFSREYFKSKFVALEFNDQPSNMLEVYLISQTIPDIIFVAELKNKGDEKNPEFVLVDFHKSFHLPQDVHVTRNQIKDILTNDKYGF